jgi:hypothetical protein
MLERKKGARRSAVWKLTPLLALALLAACGGGSDNKASTATPASTGATAAATTAAPTSATALKPADLYRALLTAAFPDSALPKGFTNADVSEGTLEDDIKQYNPVGEVDVEVTGPDVVDFISFAVFNNDADAKSHFDKGKFQDLQVTGNFPAPDLPTPNKCLTGRSSDSSDQIGASFCIVLVGNVEVLGGSAVTDNTKQGKNENAIALADAAVKHLKEIQSNPQARQATRTPTRTATATAGATRTATVLPSATRTATAVATRAPSATATRSAGPTTPQALYDALLNADFADSELPAGGFSSPEVSDGNLGPGPKQHNAVGQVDVDMDGPDAFDAILTLIYPTDSDARGRFDDITFTGDFTQTGTAPTTGLPSPSKCLTASAKVTGQDHGFTYCIAIVGNVEVQGISAVKGTSGHGDNDNAAALVRAGVAHLNKVRQGR